MLVNRSIVLLALLVTTGASAGQGGVPQNPEKFFGESHPCRAVLVEGMLPDSSGAPSQDQIDFCQGCLPPRNDLPPGHAKNCNKLDEFAELMALKDYHPDTESEMLDSYWDANEVDEEDVTTYPAPPSVRVKGKKSKDEESQIDKDDQGSRALVVYDGNLRGRQERNLGSCGWYDAIRCSLEVVGAASACAGLSLASSGLALASCAWALGQVHSYCWDCIDNGVRLAICGTVNIAESLGNEYPDWAVDYCGRGEYLSQQYAATFYQHSNYGGRALLAYHEDPVMNSRYYVPRFSDYDFNDRTSSIKTGRGMELYMYRDHYLGGPYYYVWPRTNVGYVGDSYNDWGSSAALIRFDGAIFYQHSNFRGNRHWWLCYGYWPTQCSVSYVGSYWNDRISSLSVGGCNRVTFYEHSNFGGQSYSLTGEVHFANLPDIGFNDRISSFKIERICEVW